MPDLLAHALFAYAAATFAARRFGWMTPPFTTLTMVGAMLPDLSKVYLVLDDDVLEAIVGGPIEWLALHTGGGIVLSVAIGVVAVAGRYRRRAAVVLGGGALSHVVLDLFLHTASGLAPYAIFWPLTPYRPPTPGVYLSTQLWPTALAGALAAVTWYDSTSRSP
ncbi:metal-dependent hydrolase [Haloplanus pelagicus]|uniref:metal-dependent hydrolase n=1 Tax=Haloplanus pelagicus TaxID=2949995 RepID=UPI00203B5594|nr:metal-dependent hydrolase [Haloplanus sp. HW8-1]